MIFWLTVTFFALSKRSVHYWCWLIKGLDQFDLSNDLYLISKAMWWSMKHYRDGCDNKNNASNIQSFQLTNPTYTPPAPKGNGFYCTLDIGAFDLNKEGQYSCIATTSGLSSTASPITIELLGLAKFPVESFGKLLYFCL